MNKTISDLTIISSIIYNKYLSSVYNVYIHVTEIKTLNYEEINYILSLLDNYYKVIFIIHSPYYSISSLSKKELKSPIINNMIQNSYFEIKIRPEFLTFYRQLQKEISNQISPKIQVFQYTKTVAFNTEKKILTILNHRIDFSDAPRQTELLNYLINIATKCERIDHVTIEEDINPDHPGDVKVTSNVNNIHKKIMDKTGIIDFFDEKGRNFTKLNPKYFNLE